MNPGGGAMVLNVFVIGGILALAVVPFFAIAFIVARSRLRRIRQTRPDWRFRYRIPDIWMAMICVMPLLVGAGYWIQSLQKTNHLSAMEQVLIPVVVITPFLLSQIMGMYFGKIEDDRVGPSDIVSSACYLLLGAILGPICLAAYLFACAATLFFIMGI